MKNYEERIPLRTILQHFVNHVESLEIASQTHIRDCYEEEFLVSRVHTILKKIFGKY